MSLRILYCKSWLAKWNCHWDSSTSPLSCNSITKGCVNLITDGGITWNAVMQEVIDKLKFSTETHPHIYQVACQNGTSIQVTEVYWEPELLYQAAIWLLMNVSILSPMDRSFGMLYCKRWLTGWKCQLRPIHNKQVAWQNWHICPSEIESCKTLAKSWDWVDSQPQSTHLLILLFLIGILVTLSFILRVYNFRLS